jgi:hypothetical protein
MKYFLFVFLLSSVAFAKTKDLTEFFKAYPKICKSNSTPLEVNKDEQADVAVLKCLNSEGKELKKCDLGSACEEWIFEVYLNKGGKYELLQKSASFPSTDRPTISTQNGVLKIKSHINFGSDAKEEDKYRLEDNTLRLIGVEYSISYNPQSIGEDEANASDFSVNVLSEKVEQTDHFSSAKSTKKKCKMNPVFKNVTLSESVKINVDNLLCPEK